MRQKQNFWLKDKGKLGAAIVIALLTIALVINIGMRLGIGSSAIAKISKRAGFSYFSKPSPQQSFASAGDDGRCLLYLIEYFRALGSYGDSRQAQEILYYFQSECLDPYGLDLGDLDV
jgi:hypothetical protein